MGRSQNSFIKNQKANKRKKKRQEKLQKKFDKKDQETSGKLDDMIAYVDEFGNIVDTLPEDEPKKDDKKEGEEEEKK